MGPKLPNTNKSATKNFMSPTISASFKAAAPRKKILVEGDEYSGSIVPDSHDQKTPDIDPRDPTQFTPLSSMAHELDKDERNLFLLDSSPKSYDPLTNYLSPRPRFLRYNPNRRLQIFQRRSHELGREGIGLGVDGCGLPESQKSVREEATTEAYKSSSLSFEEGSIETEDGARVNAEKLKPKEKKGEQEDEEQEDDDDDDILEVEEKMGQLPLNEILKFVFLFGVLVLSTLYISYMNSPTPSHSEKVLQVFEEGYPLQAAIKNFEVGKSLFFQKEDNNSGSLDVSSGAVSVGIEKEEVLEHELQESVKTNYMELSQILEALSGEKAYASVYEMAKIREISEHKKAQMLKPKDVENAENFESLSHSHGQFVHQNLKCDLPSASETEVNLDMEELAENQISGFLPNVEEWKDNAGILQTQRIIDEGIGETGRFGKEVEKESNFVDGMDEMSTLQGREKTENIHSSQFQFILEEMMAFASSSSDVPSTEKAVYCAEAHIRTMKDESISKAAILVVVLSLIAAFMVFELLHHKCRTSAKDPLPTDQPSSESVLIENSEKFDYCANPSSSVHYEQTASRETYCGSPAPTVELLGEVGEYSRSLKNFITKPKTIKGEDSNSSTSQKRSRRRAGSFQESPAIGSLSYGSFTSQEKIVKKKEGADGEVMKVVITPVRRSSRIHNRSVMSS